jgi:hypothetical protein
MAKSKEDYIALGRAAFDANAWSSKLAVPLSWQDKAMAQGWNERMTEMGNAIPKTLPAPPVKVWIDTKANRRANKIMKATLAKATFAARMLACDKAIRSLTRGHTDSSMIVNPNIKRGNAWGSDSRWA